MKLSLAKLLIGALGFPLLLGACSQQPAESDAATHRDQVILESYRLIDLERSDEAAQLLEEQLLKFPENLDVRMAIASAFASKAGIKAVDFLPVALRAADFGKAIAAEKALADAPATEVKINESRSSLIDTAARFAKLSGLALEIFNELPTVTPDGEILLREAIKHLQKLESTLRISDIRYRIVLRAILVKTQLRRLSRDGIGEAWGTTITDDGQILLPGCSEVVYALKDEITTNARSLSLLFVDLSATSKNEAVAQWQTASLETSELAGMVASVTEDAAGAVFILGNFSDFLPFAKDLKKNLCQ